MRILHVITSLQYGGAEKLVAEIVPMLKKKGNDIDVVAFDNSEPNFSKLLEEKGVKVIFFGKGYYSLKFLFRLGKMMKDYDIVHTHNTSPQYFAAIASLWNRKCKLVYTEHSTSNRRRNHILFKIVDKWIYSRYDKIICISEPAEENLRTYIGSGYPVMTIKNGVNVRKFMDAKSIDLGIGDCKKITMVAGFRYEKDQLTVIKALKYLPEDYHVVLVGDGSERSNIEKTIADEEMQSRVHLLGLRNDVPDILKSSDIIVMSSHREGLSLSNVEGMCSGHPFVASDVEGLREVTKGYGLLFPHGDAKVLADIVIKLCSDKVYADEISKMCQKRASEYDIQKMVDEYQKAYEVVMNEK